MRATMRATIPVLATVLAVLAGGCGGKPAPAAPGGGGEGDGVDEATAGDDQGDDAMLIPPERMDEVKALLDRKRAAAARCFADVANAGKVDKNSHGHLALGFVISPAGKATDVKVLEDNLASPELEQCVIGKVEQIDFGALPKPLEWSYTFAFESM